MLAVFALVDILVIIALGYTVTRTYTATEPNISAQKPDTCGLRLIEALSEVPGYRSTVAYNPSSQTLHVTLNAHKDTPQVSRGAQSLWTGLSVAASKITKTCPSATTLILTVEVSTPYGPEYHIAHLPTDGLADWAQGKIDDDQLAAISKYRYIQSQLSYPTDESKD